MEKLQMEKLSIKDQSTQPSTPKGGRSNPNLNIIENIGKGNYASVYAVQVEGQSELYALKAISKARILNSKKKHYIKNERKIYSLINNQFLTKCHFAFQTERELYFGLDFCRGGDFYDLISKKGKLKENEAKFYIGQLILAIHHLHHHNIIHRDLKLENILLHSDGYIKLTDFGLSTLNITGNSGATSFCGTPFYMAPEMIQRKSYGKAVDWWAIGVLLFEMLTGNPPHHLVKTETLYELIVSSSPDYPSYIKGPVKDFLMQLLNTNPSHRLGSLKGAEELMKHEWFNDISWTKLQKKELQAPFIPNVVQYDTKYKQPKSVIKNFLSIQKKGNEDYFSDFSIDPEDQDINEIDSSKSFYRVNGERRTQ